MDYQSYQQPGEPFLSKRSHSMETASLVFGILSVVLFCCVYPPMVCGALGIVFALLSRGGELTLTARAKTGLILSSVGLGLFVLLMVFCVVFLSIWYGGFPNMIETIYEQYQLYGDDYTAFYNALMESIPQMLL